MVLTCMLAAALALSGPNLLVSTHQLGAMKNTLLVDTRPLPAFEAGHIPGAAHLDVASLSETRHGVKGLLKPVTELRDLLGKAGVSPDKHIVAYSAMKVPDDIKDATRVFWVLDYLGYDNVSVLDGGYAKWIAEKRPVETGPSKVKPIPPPKVHLRPDRIASKAQVEKFLAEKAGIVADLRPPNQYTGKKKNAKLVARAGHIPGAESLPADNFVQPGKPILKTTRALDAMLDKGGINTDTKVITYCNTGRQASVGYFVMRLTGHNHVALYDGSMSQWSADPTCKMAMGAGHSK